MPVSGSEVVKLLPGRKPCKDCGFPTCFAFAMKLVTGAVGPEKCPHLTAEQRSKIEEVLAPPIRLVAIGKGEKRIEIGNEEVVYRHEKTFLHPPGIALLVSDDEDDGKIQEKMRKLKEIAFPWVGLTLRADLLAIAFRSGSKERFLSVVKKAYEDLDHPLILVSEDLDALFAARDICVDRNPLLHAVTRENLERAIPEIKKAKVPVCVKSDSLEGLSELTKRLKDERIEDVVLDISSKSFLDAIRDQTFIRKAALRQGYKPLGYPTIAFPCFMAKDGMKEFLYAAMFVIKYAGLIVLSDFDERTLLPLLVQRLNIYTDPRFPMAVEEKYYEIGEVNDNSPVLVTSNWALTYFIVSSAIEATKIPSFLCVKDTEGLGVLTGWAAGKFTGDQVAQMIKKVGIESRVRHRKLVIPGKVARIRGELEEALPGWEIVVGPREASGIGAFLPEFAKSLK